MPVFEPSLQHGFLIRVETRPSTVAGAGDGVFALEPATRGKLLGMDFPDPANAATAQEVWDLPIPRRMFSWRHVEHVCFRAPASRHPTDHLNHSFAPNVLWHVGTYFAQEDIAAGDELFVDYRYLLDPLWSGRLRDGDNGAPVDGFGWRDALLRSSRQLVELLESTAPRPD